MKKICLMLITFLAITAIQAGQPTNEELAAQVRATEIAFAKSMADRDLKTFGSFIADEALFFGSKRVLRGKQAVVEGWKGLFEGAKPPFSWAPDRVEVLDSGTQALSTGPVLDPDGKRVGTFTSIWRREADGKWKILFDSGCPPCDCDKKEPAGK